MKEMEKPAQKSVQAPRKTEYTLRQRPGTVTRFLGEMDRPFLIIVLLLVSIGSIAVFSSSYAHAAQRYNDSYALAKPQLGYVAIGLVLMTAIVFFANFVLEFLRRFPHILFWPTVVLNILVRFVGENYNGATRWIIIGPFQFQPSELLKFTLVLVCVNHIAKNRDRMHTIRYGLLPLGFYMAVAAMSTLLQSHLSATIINCLIVYIMMWLGGVGSKLLVTITVGAAAFVATVGRFILETFVPHALTRLQVWQDPFSFMSNASGGKGWQPAQSLYAISSGGFWGLGLGQSNQKHGYLPEPYNDYIFAIICEEMGFFGAVLIIGLFGAFAWRGFHIAARSQDKFSSLLVLGIVSHVIIQVVLNIAVVTNSVPSTGISLPFFSYGGTSLIILLCEMGLVLAVSRFSYTEKA